MTNRHNAHAGTPVAAAEPTRVANTEMAPAPGGQPRFAQPVIDQHDPTKFKITHGSDTAAYKILDQEARAKELKPIAFPPSRGGPEPTLTLKQVLGDAGAEVEAHIEQTGQLVFHSVGDTGNTRGPEPQNEVADKMEADYADEHPENLPRFFFHLGDVIYSFGESKYYYDQFYDAYRNYPAPIVALAGNHDGMVAPGTDAKTLEAFWQNFCSETFEIAPEAGGLDRTTQIQPGVYFTFEAPFVRILALYTNTLEDPGIISSEGGAFPDVTDVQLDYLRAALGRIKSEDFKGAVIIAHHHPSYTAGARHGWSETVRKDIDKICDETGIWPHAVLSAHAHNYQRFTRVRGEMAIPYIIAGNGGHGLARLARKNEPTIRAPAVIDTDDGETVTLENYDDQDYGYLRVVVDKKQLRIEYHPASDGGAAKTPDDSVTVDLATHVVTRYNAPDHEANAPQPAPEQRERKAGHHPAHATPARRRRQRAA